jgi:hypothetical protein
MEGNPMALLHPTRLPAFLLAALLALVPAWAPAAVEERDEPVEEGEAEFDEIEVLKQKAAREGDFELDEKSRIAVDRTVIERQWNAAPFNPRFFSYTPQQIEQNWPKFMRALRVPYPSKAYLEDRYNRFAIFRDSYPNFDGDFEQMHRDVVEVWRLFFRGDFQASLKKGETLGVAGRIPGKLSQIIYAIYLEPELDKKHMLLQDAANAVAEYGDALNQMKKEKKYWDDYVMIRVGYAYAIGRIAEDVPIPVAIARNYVFKVMGAANDVNDMAPNHPIGLGFKAGIDANVVRKVGKATGRITFGAKQSDVEEYFKQAFAIAPDVSILRYEYANALMYVNKKRQIDKAMEELRRGAQIRPTYAMEALDAMYAAKRLKEVEALAKSPMSFRSFERKRLKHQKDRNENLYCVLPERCQPFIVK